MARSTFPSQNVQEKHMLGPLLRIQMWFWVAGARDSAPAKSAKREGLVAPLHYTTLHYITLPYATLHYTHYTHYTTLHSTHSTHYTTVQYSTVQYSTPRYTTLRCITRHYTTLQLATCNLQLVT